MGYTMTGEFWDRFIRDHWGTKPGVFEGVLDQPFVTDGELMSVIQGVSASLVDHATAEAPRPSKVRMFVDGRVVPAREWIKFRPTSSDLDSYVRDVKSRFEEGDALGWVINDLQEWNPALMERFRAFSSDLLERIGLPALAVETAVFMGDYAVTPFGIHRDPGNSVFTFAVSGRKRFLLWPPDYFDGRKLELMLHPDPENYIEDAIDLEIGPHDMMFWPADWYHTAYSESSEFNASVSLGLWHMVHWPKLLGYFTEQIASDLLGPSGMTTTASLPPSTELPAEFDSVIRKLEEALAGGELRERMRAEWVERVERGGFRDDDFAQD